MFPQGALERWGHVRIASHLTLTYTEVELRTGHSMQPTIGPWIREKEDDMYEFTVLISMLLLRIVHPVAVLIGFGEISRSRRRPTLKGM